MSMTAIRKVVIRTSKAVCGPLAEVYCNDTQAVFKLLRNLARALRQRSYLIVFEATPESALSAPVLVYALTVKYHFPG
jgi:hypothetical protein